MSDTEARILAGITELARVHFGWKGDLRPEMRLVEDLELDSLKGLTLALEVENHFRVCLDDEQPILTVGDLVRSVREGLDG